MTSASQPQFVTAIGQPAGIQSQQQILVSQPYRPPKSDPFQRRKKSLCGMGTTEAILGSLSILLTVVSMAIAKSEAYQYYQTYSSNYDSFYYSRHYNNLNFTYSSQGIWGGLFVIITGVLGIRVKSKPTRSNYIGNMVMAIIAANIAGAAFILSSIAASVYYYSRAMTSLHALIAIVNFASMVVTIVHASFCCCCGVCCYRDSTSTPHQVVYNPYFNVAATQQPQYVQGPNGQIFVMGHQPVTLQAPVGVVQPAFVQTSVPPQSQASTSGYSPHRQQQDSELPPKYSDPMEQVTHA